MNEIKLGSRVKVVESPYMADELQAGAIGTVVKEYADATQVRVDDYRLPIHGVGWFFGKEQLEVING